MAAQSQPSRELAPMPQRAAAVAEEAYLKRQREARIYSRTRGVMVVLTESMFALASRDYQRERFAPIKRTKPALHMRRYSVDVNTLYSNLINTKVAGQQKYYPSTPPCTNDPYPTLEKASLTNIEYLSIIRTSAWPSFMSDSALDTAFVLLSHDEGCASAHIGIARTIEAQRWIFIPVNDGLGAQLSDGTQGTHWTLVALDRVHNRMHYYDSLAMGREEYWNTAVDVARGMLGMVGEQEEAEWEFVAEWNSPHQYRDNHCSVDVGPCGPFVYSMVLLLVDRIQHYQRASAENQCHLGLGNSFPMCVGIGDLRRWRDVEGWATLHDRTAVEGEGVECVSDPAIRINVSRWDTGSDQLNNSGKSAFSDATAISNKAVRSEVIELSSDGDDVEMASLGRAAPLEPGMSRTSPAEGEGVPPPLLLTGDDVIFVQDL
ncbi:hypothetical protein SVAN01_00795 [Stagonosporopsis vannaccii]|nr:hypothetical protein SVAN01_00795 [Stagonosporopsis vannaccii]